MDLDFDSCYVCAENFFSCDLDLCLDRKKIGDDGGDFWTYFSFGLHFYFPGGIEISNDMADRDVGKKKIVDEGRTVCTDLVVLDDWSDGTAFESDYDDCSLVDADADWHH